MTITPISQTKFTTSDVFHFHTGEGTKAGVYTGVALDQKDDHIAVRLYSAGCLHDIVEVSNVTKIERY